MLFETLERLRPLKEEIDVINVFRAVLPDGARVYAIKVINVKIMAGPYTIQKLSELVRAEVDAHLKNQRAGVSIDLSAQHDIEHFNETGPMFCEALEGGEIEEFWDCYSQL